MNSDNKAPHVASDNVPTNKPHKQKPKITVKRVCKFLFLLLLIAIFYEIWYLIVGATVLWYWGKHERAKNKAIVAERERLGITVEPAASQTHWYNWQLPKQSKWYTIIGMTVALGFLAIVIMLINKDAKNKVHVITQAERASNVKTGDTAKLRLPGSNDPSQIICLGVTEDDHKKVVDAMTAKDTQGILEIPGAFCVHNGATVTLLENGLLRRKVRITEVVDTIDQDKVGRSGWVDREFVIQ